MFVTVICDSLERAASSLRVICPAVQIICKISARLFSLIPLRFSPDFRILFCFPLP